MEASTLSHLVRGFVISWTLFLILVAIGWYGSKARESHSLKDFYLGGKGIGWWVLLLTLLPHSGGNTMLDSAARPTVWAFHGSLPCTS